MDIEEDIDLNTGLSRLNKLKGLTEKKTQLEEKTQAEEKALSEAKEKARKEIDIMDRINAFQQGFESEEEGDEEEEEEEEGNGNSLKLDLSTVQQEGHEDHQKGIAMYQSKSKFNQASLAANFLSENGEEGAESVPALKPIRSVGEVRSQYRERVKASEAQVRARHARHVAAKAVTDSQVMEEKKRKKKKKKKAEAKSSLDYLEEDGVVAPDPTVSSDVLLLSNLGYVEFSSNYIMRGDLMKQCGDVLQSGRSLVLRTCPEEDTLDAKMMLRTIATELATYHASEFIIPDIVYDNGSGTTEMRLEPK